MRKTAFITAVLFLLGIGMLSCSDLIEMVLPNPWGISKKAPLGTIKKTKAYFREKGLEDTSGRYDLNFIGEGEVHYFSRAGDERTSIVVIESSGKVLGVRGAFNANLATPGNGLMNDLWEKLTGKLPKLEVTEAATSERQAIWTGRFNAKGVTGLWESEGLGKTVVYFALDNYADSITNR